ncbi:MAG: recombination regulator RecX [Streptococcaceae bacterium]|jgi:regulatory protein|nr:recombination regulator RecX [Streptococcaceae bacterium]
MKNNKSIIIASVTKEKQGYQVTLDNGEQIDVTEDILISYNLLKGSKISEEYLLKIKKDTIDSRGLQLAYAYLQKQLRTKKEVQEFLRKQKILDEALEKILKKLQDLQLINDKSYAESYVRTKACLNKKGPQVIKQNLLKKGIREDIINNALLEHFSNDQQINNANKLAEKLVKKYQIKSYKEKLQKIHQGLIIKGFSSDIAKAAVESLELIKDENHEWTQLQKEGEKVWQRTSRLEAYKRRQKIKQSLYQKGFSIENIDHFIEFKENIDD